jgi:shikimate 5-dehydrogenase
MAVSMLKNASKSTFYFIGVTTSKSSIMRIFPQWVSYLKLGDVDIKGIDCAIHDDPQTYRDIVSFIKEDSLSLGGLVTTHKMDLLAAARGLFDYLDPFAELLGEISSISKRSGQLRGYAKDPITSGLAMESFVPRTYWKDTGSELCILGAGGSSLALTCYIMKQKKRDEWPSKIIVTNRTEPRLRHMQKIHSAINPGIPVEYVHAPEPSLNDSVVNSLKAGSLVVNATGLGKDQEGSPLTDGAIFPTGGIVWEFNYRGNLIFLDQARAQKSEKSLTIEDGWIYFIHGWTQVMSEVFDHEIPVAGPIFDDLCRIAAEYR